MRLLFLDVDGVLNSTDWIQRRPSKEAFAAEMNLPSEEYEPGRMVWALRSIDPVAVERLNLLATLSGARIVLSSSWRTMFALTRMDLILRRRGCEHRLLGATPCNWDEPERADRRLLRGDEIHRWLSLLPSFRREDIVILDDGSDMAPYTDRLVQTDPDVGLTDADVERAMALWETR